MFSISIIGTPSVRWCTEFSHFRPCPTACLP
uniref:Uncharacterized protein n=1 Tax=Rhizophora mucronata TaxID=61149 RepID=A0A2P2QER1_RHIMU